MEIRPLQEADVEAFIDELWLPAQREMAAAKEYTLADGTREKGLDYTRSKLSEDDSITYLARREENLIGYVAAEIQTPPPIIQQVRECHITELYVREDARRHGVASNLIATVEDWGRAQDCEYSDLYVHADNQAARELYKTESYTTYRYNMRKPLPDETES